ncbi:hypothetical protein R1flu_010021 [Riccia fluitans]|uniref:E3 ubiquitin-protein ligase SHPRH n=1 Tax=Riccia fluitans TaxID=41844 RepID=A0ABD1Z3U0_9MARC
MVVPASDSYPPTPKNRDEDLSCSGAASKESEVIIMGKRKQRRPKRSNGPMRDEGVECVEEETGLIDLTSGEDETYRAGAKRARIQGKFVRGEAAVSELEAEELPLSTITLGDICGKEVAEIPLLNTSGPDDQLRSKELMVDASIRVQVQWRNEQKTAFWSLPDVSRDSFRVLIVMWPTELSEDNANNVLEAANDHSVGDSFGPCQPKVLHSGEIDGSNAALSALVYLIQQQYVSLKPSPCSVCSKSLCSVHPPSGRLRVIIADKAFRNSVSTIRQWWRRSMQKIMAWLRPEIHPLMKRSSEEAMMQTHAGLSDKQPFDPTALYDAVKPLRTEECPDMSFPQLLPDLRPYQRDAAYWMVQRENGNGKTIRSSESASASTSSKCNVDAHPSWLVVTPTDGSSEFYYNPISGAVSLEPDDFVSYVRGGILADEMGLGKTVELLACILANPNKEVPSPSPAERSRKDLEETLSRRRLDRVDCVCGSVEEDDYEHEWIKCEICDAWQHATCVGLSKDSDDFLEKEDDKQNDASKRSGEVVSTRKRVAPMPVSCRNPRTKWKTGESTKNKGKTAEYKKKIFSTRRKFVCSVCIEIKAKVEVDGACGSTLIVCPAPILQQWQEEIQRHTVPGSIRVMVYEGAGKGARLVRSPLDTDHAMSSKPEMIAAHDLAAADIVLTTYDTLRTDLSHEPDKTKVVKRSMRYFKRYPVIPTPLTRLRWWRICLDEAQMVECSTSSATEMALLLETENRWCVSGTPIQRGLDDVFGLLKFLQAKPFDDLHIWKQVLQFPYQAGDQWSVEYMHKFLGTIMWRNSKDNVKDELNLPGQEENVSWLRFSPTEAYFYQQQHEKCALKARDVLQKYGKQLEEAPGTDSNKTSSVVKSMRDADTPLPQAAATLLANSLRQLRQACCHPQVGSSGIGSLQQRRPMTMKSILQKLLNQAKRTAGEAQRNLIAAWNGLAGLAIIDNDIPKAVSLYMEALSLIGKSSTEVTTDPLQKLHTLHNLADILVAHGRTIEGTPTVDVLVNQSNEIKSKYLGAYVMRSDNEKAKYRLAHEQVAQAEDACEASGGSSWWLEVLSVTGRDIEKGEELVEKIKNHFLENAAAKRGRVENASSLTHRFRDISGLKLVLQNELDAIEEKRRNVLTKLKELERMMDNLTVEDAERHANCKNHSQEKGRECTHCQMERLFHEYENRLLLLRTSASKADGVVSLEEAIFAQERLAAERRVGESRDETLIEEDLYGPSGRRTRELNATQAQVLGAPSETEVILSLIKGHARMTAPRHAAGKHLQIVEDIFQPQREAATKHLQMFEALKKEYWQMRKWVAAQKFLLLAFDELNMATLRQRLLFRGEKPETVVERKVKVHPEELPARKLQLELDRDEAKVNLLSAEGSMRYLQGLTLRREEESLTEQPGCSSQKSTLAGAGDPEEEENCKICYGKFGSERMILRCGHFFCNSCCLRLMAMGRNNTTLSEKNCVFCPTCRRSTDVSEITLINDGLENYLVMQEKGHRSNDVTDREEAHLKVIGDYGTKIGAIVRRMLWLKSKDPLAKVLVFSTWPEVLDVVGHAFTENDISFVLVKGGRKFDRSLDEFKSSSEGHVQALLLPFKRGSNGLNLVEAQHVFLVDPLPNPGVEAQAINRIHRIGQLHATFVHRFIVKDTVEERIFELGRKKEKFTLPSRQQNVLTFSDVGAMFAPEIYPDEGISELQEHPESADNYRNISAASAAGSAAEARRIANLTSQQVV